jgi:hypothetical protein
MNNNGTQTQTQMTSSKSTHQHLENENTDEMKYCEFFLKLNFIKQIHRCV